MATFGDYVLHIAGQDFAQMGPTQIEHAAEIAKRLYDALWRVGGNWDIDPSIHTLEYSNRGGMLCKISGASQPVFRTAVFTAMVVGVIEQPVNTLFNRFTMDTHDHPPAGILLFAGNLRIHYFSDRLHAAQNRGLVHRINRTCTNGIGLSNISQQKEPKGTISQNRKYLSRRL
jgi:hypothetical protein